LAVYCFFFISGFKYMV